MPWVSFSFLQALPPQTITWVQCTHCHLTLTMTSRHRDPNSWPTRSLAKSRRAWMTASAPFYKSHKNMKVLENWKRADFRLRSFTWMTSFNPRYRDPRKYSRARQGFREWCKYHLTIPVLPALICLFSCTSLSIWASNFMQSSHVIVL